MRFIIADTHFCDKNIIPFANRPFADVEEMNNAMIEKWNSVVGESDEVYVVGDYMDVSGVGKNLLGKLNGKKYLIKGNHDTLSNEVYRQMGFAEVYDVPIILDGFFILSHEPLYMNETMPYVNIFGHVHNNPIYKDCSKQHFCVSVERPHMSYVPIPFAKIKDIVQSLYKA